MRKVSFKVAKTLKEAGYPQGRTNYKYAIKKCKVGYLCGGCNPDYTSENDYEDNLYDFEEGELIDGDLYRTSVTFAIDAPTYLDAWLWLWREKKIYFGVEAEEYPHDGTCLNDYQDIPYTDPEEAIIVAIEYLVENNLIK